MINVANQCNLRLFYQISNRVHPTRPTVTRPASSALRMLPLMKRFQFSRRQECDTSAHGLEVQLDRVHVARKSGVVSRKTNYHSYFHGKHLKVGHERYICVAPSKVYTYLDARRGGGGGGGGDRGDRRVSMAVLIVFHCHFVSVYTGHGARELFPRSGIPPP